MINLCTGLFFILLFSSCGTQRKTTITNGASSSDPSVSPNLVIKLTGVHLVAASALDCPSGGTLVQTFDDANLDGLYQAGESILSSTNICNGANGVDGQAGIGAGIIVEAAPVYSCPAGGSIFKTFPDLNNNTILDNLESVSSVTTLCNGIDGQDGADGQDGQDGQDGTNGLSSHLSVAAATLGQCPNGGSVYTSSMDGQAVPDVTIVCNGLNGANGGNGQNGANAEFQMGPTGPMVANKNYSACHHDYLYLPNSTDPARGWLTFRHQGNGSFDQGIGSTGFQIWNVDIGNFALASEVGNVTYCTFSWNAQTRVLNYTVVDNTDGLAGQTGQISF